MWIYTHNIHFYTEIVLHPSSPAHGRSEGKRVGVIKGRTWALPLSFRADQVGRNSEIHLGGFSENSSERDLLDVDTEVLTCIGPYMSVVMNGFVMSTAMTMLTVMDKGCSVHFWVRESVGISGTPRRIQESSSHTRKLVENSRGYVIPLWEVTCGVG